MIYSTYPLRQRGWSIRTFMGLVLLLGVVVGAWYYFGFKQDQSPTSTHLTETITKRDIQSTVLASGTLEALRQVAVGAQVSGEISTLYVEIGDNVKKGDPIAEIDARTQTNTRDTAMTQLKIRQAALESAQASLRAAQQKYNRQQALFKRGATARENVESATTALDNAKSSVEQAKLAVSQSRIEVDNAGLNLGYTSVDAPMDGVVISVAVEQGQTVNASQSAPTIVTIARLDSMVVKAEIAEADVSKVGAGMSAYFHLLGDQSRRYDTTIQSIDPAPTNVSNNQSANQKAVYYYGKMQVDNPEGRLRIGMTANAQIVTAAVENVLSIPMTALGNKIDGRTYQVLVEQGQETIQRNIEIGIDDGVYAQIISGLTEGEAVVISTLGAGRSTEFRGHPF